MNIHAPPSLLELASQSLLRDKALAIAALEDLPMELFPPLFTMAFAGRHREAVKAIVQAWPFTCLPLRALLKEQRLHRETLHAVFDGLDILLALNVRPRRWKLEVLDLRKHAHQNLWSIWSGSRTPGFSLMEPGTAHPMNRRQKVEDSRVEEKQPLAPLEVLLDLYLKEDTPDEFLSYIIKKVKERKEVLYLCCNKLKIFAMPIQNIRKILNVVQLKSIQNVEVNCTWKLSTLGRFAPYLGQMVNLHSLFLSHIHKSSEMSLEKQKQYINQFTSQFFHLHHLRVLHLDSVSFLKGRLDQVLRCLNTPLEILSITNCLLLESDLMHLSLCPMVSQLTSLSLSGVSLTNLSPGPLKVLLETVSATLQLLDLDECGIMDSQFTVLFPALGRCSQLTVLSFSGNPISLAVLENLLTLAVGLSKLSHVQYPAPLESYDDTDGTPHPGRLAQLHARLRQMLQEAGRPSMIWSRANACPRCGDRIFYDPGPLLCPCCMPV
ncbi:melanoma antigen preferentially expressed in tumors [Dasypus novemcinctus]|uniref:melanoma antigen preferentially expressed in tumors n=1 Tax=Dasypus novemcinctus TaxID=9361 RepID=UPI0003289FEF|nr:melanoma antigen preferentially expressed in tumors isoform X2 [Dasypus novemcinctus]XP_058137707.1 melanoma antigen preferentially expressed in tumors isoform X2 [Dasypus novemcinctus]XP_058137708.1 melanoma antigen preferentially expressed in tumors isoform X2 [Dasypus novemcinctus]XP_058137709.1 melanoma antigen preferentially expressed in tumors isoform X2 [Dasypus novemcinctus]XP_058137710.1 melanoma antigen preferentially expressed in tumors isoform X2 [Dasypus novemcinctus]XP_0581377